MKYIYVLIVLFSLTSCSNDDYLIDGGLANQNVGVSTYDFLKSNKQLDTLAILIQKAGMIDVVNAKSTTLFAPNNLSIKKYIYYMKEIEENQNYGINDIPVANLKEMLGAYIFNESLDRSKLVKEGKVYTAHNGEERLLSLEPVEDYKDQLDQFPEYVYYTVKGGGDWDPTDAVDDDVKTVVRTSNLISTNGVIHVLQGSHHFSNYID
ncbi:fasciclin domain-containing protein [Flavobacterium sp. ov086]|uniref:fasciclin domain-containing protein n=1 Tax=Flavobacterium sp. ov086 TaxID=1761785 RepID=UPI000B73FD9C|nr:fasciclin domain-containing protein [Flavobacterium sp. ov086]SNR39198.1 Fasciclin domain-containing protein [Flavobacterium sp. ov086]